MKLTTFLALLAVASAARSHVQGGALRTHGRRGAAGVVVLPEDQERCEARVSGFLSDPLTKTYAIEKAVDSCALDWKIEARNYVCPHVRDMLTDAFRGVADDKELDATKFCEISEFHALRMRGSTRVSNIGEGTILNFTIVGDCQKTVLDAMAPEQQIPKKQVPDFWYSLCINQDCAHFLPSRTKWCKVDRTPTHGIEVCTLMQDFARDQIGTLALGKLCPSEVCGLYDKFVEKVGDDVESYDHFMHRDHHERGRSEVPVPEDHNRALTSAKLLNDAQHHHFRDNSGTPVKEMHSAATRTAAAAAAALAAMALLA